MLSNSVLNSITKINKKPNTSDNLKKKETVRKAITIKLNMAFNRLVIAEQIDFRINFKQFRVLLKKSEKKFFILDARADQNKIYLK